jgi:hypothetical protein
MNANQAVQRTGASRLAQSQIESQRRLAPVADLDVSFEPMGAVVYIAFLLGLIFLGWPPLFYRRFSRDGHGRPLGRAILWSACLYFLSVLIADLTFHYPVGWLYPLLLLGAPVPFNLFALLRGLATAKK